MGPWLSLTGPRTWRKPFPESPSAAGSGVCDPSGQVLSRPSPPPKASYRTSEGLHSEPRGCVRATLCFPPLGSDTRSSACFNRVKHFPCKPLTPCSCLPPWCRLSDSVYRAHQLVFTAHTGLMALLTRTWKESPRLLPKTRPNARHHLGAPGSTFPNRPGTALPSPFSSYMGVGGTFWPCWARGVAFGQESTILPECLVSQCLEVASST